MRERSRRPLAAILVRVALPLVWPGMDRVVRELREGRWPSRNRSFIDPGFARRVRRLPAPRVVCAGARQMQIRLIRNGHLAERMDGWAASGARRGIEYGYPLLDRRVLEFALGLPPEQYRRGPANRCLMRRALGALLPAPVCRYVDKRDPIRYGAFLRAVDGSLPVVRRILAARSEPPARSAYLDMPRLAASLESARPRGETRRSGIVNALRFLDF